MNWFLGLIARILAVYTCVYVLPGVSITNHWHVLLFVVVLALINFLIKPLLLIVTLPLRILTLGLFTIVINVATIMLADYFVDGISIVNFWYALLFSTIYSSFVVMFKVFFDPEARMQKY